MGIKDFLKIKIKNKTIKDYGKNYSEDFIRGKSLAIDAMNVIYKNMILGDTLTHNGKITSHIRITLSKIAYFKKMNVETIWIFDGKQEPLKKETNEKRRQTRKITITTEMINDIKQLLRLAAVPYLVVPTEAEFYAAELVKKGLYTAVLTSDMDVIVRGGVLLREETINNKKTYFYLSAESLLKDISQDDIIRIAIHMGCDFAPKTPRIGPSSVYKKYKTDLTERQQQAFELFKSEIDLKNIMEKFTEVHKPDFTELTDWLLLLGFQKKTITQYTKLFN